MIEETFIIDNAIATAYETGEYDIVKILASMDSTA